MAEFKCVRVRVCRRHRPSKRSLPDRSAGQLVSIGSDPKLYNGKYFILVADIDLDPNLPGGKVFDGPVIPMLSLAPGSLDGRNHVVRNLVIYAPEKDNVGLVGISSSGAIKNLGLINVQVVGRDNVGGLVGARVSDSALTSCYATGIVTGRTIVGGLLGSMKDGTLSSCHTSVSVSGTSVSSSVGGLVGSNRKGKISSCHASGSVIGTATGTTAATCVGGLVGYNSEGTISSCYASASATGTNSGGLVGYTSGSTISSCYAVGKVTGISAGGLVGYTDFEFGGGLVFFSFWDVQTTGQATSSGGIGKTTAEMMASQTFRDWGFDGQWTINEGHDYPRLAWEARPDAPIVTPTPTYGGGTGEPNDPYQIWTAEHLASIGWFHFAKSFILMGDIDLGSIDPNAILPIGSLSIPFKGRFHGQGHTVSNLRSSTVGVYAGLFGYVSWSGLIEDIHPAQVDVSGDDYVGGLAGYNAGTIRSCSVTGRVTGLHYVGGLVGRNSGVISDCFADTKIAGSGSSVGGLVGYNQKTISSCYAVGSITGSYGIGGLAGDNLGTVTHCYSTGVVSGETNVGGLMGLMNLNFGIVTNCFWDTQASGQITSAGGNGKTTIEMQAAKTFMDAGWDFANTWTICEGVDYPRLKWENRP